MPAESVSQTPAWVAAGATVLASTVALFGPGWRDYRRRPRLDLALDDPLSGGYDLMFVGESPHPGRTEKVALLVTNRGRGQAQDVEAVLNAYEAIPADDDIPQIDIPAVVRGLLRFELADQSQPRLVVPPKTSRTLWLATLATHDRVVDDLQDEVALSPAGELDAEQHPAVGYFAVWPTDSTNRRTWIEDDKVINVEITLAASNATARTWTGAVRVFEYRMQGIEPPIRGICLEWERPLTSTSRSLRIADWVKGHTPRRIWSDWRFKRAMKAAEGQDEDEGDAP